MVVNSNGLGSAPREFRILVVYVVFLSLEGGLPLMVASLVRGGVDLLPLPPRSFSQGARHVECGRSAKHSRCKAV